MITVVVTAAVFALLGVTAARAIRSFPPGRDRNLYALAWIGAILLATSPTWIEVIR